MKTTIRTKFILYYLLLALAMQMLFHCYGHKIVVQKILESSEANLYDKAVAICQEYISDDPSSQAQLNISIPELRTRLRSLDTLSDIRVWLADASGNILLDSHREHNAEQENINAYDPHFLTQRTNIGNTLGTLQGEETLSLVQPLTSNMNTKGYLVLLLPMENIQKRAQFYINTLTPFSLLFLFLLLLAFLCLDYQITRPLRSMTKAARQYASNHFEHPMPHFADPNYRQLAATLEYLAEKMKAMNDYQKKFVANVSHDFRSPLTSIKGYTEAILDGTIPPEKQKKYLDIILFETQRLTKLTSNLLELNQFETSKMLLQFSTFNINHILKMTTAAFEQQCLQKRITFRLTFSDKNLLVDADITKIERVIQNLVDNAIKFSKPDSSIDISTVKRNDKVFVSVKDHGVGIPKENLEKIWSRFYKTETSRGQDKTGNGLGLSITKEIIQAHGENIKVISTEGAGTEFIFSLQSHAPDSRH